jgi:L-serine/L-threonine ammonia-lyase
MAHLCHPLREERGATELLCSSGGNAGLAAATVARQLGGCTMRCTVVVPETTRAVVLDRLRSLGADVLVFGENWNAADERTRRLAEERAHAAYVPPYDHPLLWTGHSTVIDEVCEELGEIGAVIVSVGGGGLICGVLEGLRRRRMFSTAVIAAETVGAASFGKSFQRGELVRLDSIDSIATSLGALEVTPEALERARQHIESGGAVQEALCTDAEAVDACLQFAADHRILVEPACGAALAVAYTERLRDQILKDVEGPIVIEVCGGSGVNLDLLMQWKKEFAL